MTTRPPWDAPESDRPGYKHWPGAVAMGADEPAAVATRALPTTRTRWLDGSHWQGVPDFAKVAADGWAAWVTKLTQGTELTDAQAGRNLREAEAHGMLSGAYHWLKREDSVASQLDFFSNALDARGGADGRLVMLDAETFTPTGTDPTWAQVVDWMTRARARYGCWPKLYAPRWWMQKIGAADQRFHPEWSVVCSDYGASPDPLYGGLSSWAGHSWQYTSTAAVPGVQGGCDADIYFGTRAELAALAVGGAHGGDWLSMATQEDVKDALRQVLRLSDAGMAVPVGQTNNDQVFKLLVGYGQREFNDLGEVKSAIEVVRRDVDAGEKAVLAALTAMRVTLSDADIVRLAASVGIDYAKVAAAVGTDLAARIAQ